MNVYRVVIKGRPRHGDEYEREQEVLGETEGDARRRLKTMLSRNEAVVTVTYDRRYE